MVMERRLPPEGATRPPASPSPPQMSAVVIDRDGTALDRIATALERLVELAEQAGPEITPDIILDEDGKLMHCTGRITMEPFKGEQSAYIVAHDPTAAILSACTHWGVTRADMTDLRADYDD